MKLKRLIIGLHFLLISLFSACEREDMFDFAKNGTSHKWKYTGSAGITSGTASSISIAVYDNTPYVAYIEASIPKVIKYNGSAWVQVGADLDTSASDIDITMNGSTPFAIYSTSGGTYVKYFDGSSWTSYGSQASLSPTSFNDIIFSSGIAYIGYYSSPSTFALNYSAGSWAQIDTACAGASSYMTLSATTSDLYVTFAVSNAVTVMKNTIPATVTWAPITPSAQSGQDFSSQIYSGQPTVAFSDANNGNKASVIRYSGSGTTWSNLGAAGFSDSTAFYVSMTLFEGTLHVAYVDGFNSENKITAMRYKDGTWLVDDIPRFTPSSSGELALAGGERKMFVAFSDNSAGGRLSVMEY